MQFLAKKAINRLGYGPQAPEEIKGHAFFRVLEWEKVENREEEPPIKPTLVRKLHIFFILFNLKFHIERAEGSRLFRQ